MAYDVHLDVFEGPLDLLLYLIKKEDMEISEIPIAQITQEYLSYMDVIKELNLEVAGDFLVMASTLMQIKARMLLPGAETEEEESPLDELKARLLEYQRIKEVAQLLGHRENEYSNIYYRPAPVIDKSDFTLEVSLFDLISSFKEVLQELPVNVKEIVYEEIPIERKIREVLDFLEGKEFITVKELFQRSVSRIDLVVSFLAVLELIRLKQVIVRQKEVFGEARVYRITGPVESAGEETEQYSAAVPQKAVEGQEELDFQKAAQPSADDLQPEQIPLAPEQAQRENGPAPEEQRQDTVQQSIADTARGAGTEDQEQEVTATMRNDTETQMEDGQEPVTAQEQQIEQGEDNKPNGNQ